MYLSNFAQVQWVCQCLLVCHSNYMQHVPTGASDSFQLRLADPLGHVLCDLTHTVMDVGPNNGLRQLSALYQNASECISNSSWIYAASLMITTDRSVDKFYVDEVVMISPAIAGQSPMHKDL